MSTAITALLALSRSASHASRAHPRELDSLGGCQSPRSDSMPMSCPSGLIVRSTHKRVDEQPPCTLSNGQVAAIQALMTSYSNGMNGTSTSSCNYNISFDALLSLEV